MGPASLDARVSETLARPIVPPPWESTDTIDCPWWSIRLPNGTTIVGFVGIGVVLYELGDDGIVHVSWTLADAHGPGAAERRAWIRSSIRSTVGTDVLEVDMGRVVHERGIA